MAFIIEYVAYIVLTCMGLVFIKIGGKGCSFSSAGSVLSMKMDYRLVLGLICYALSFILYTIILQKKDLSYIYPLSAGIINVVTVIAGVLILKEKINLMGIIGVVAIVIGVTLLNIK